MGQCLVQQSNLAGLRVVRSRRFKDPGTPLFLAVQMRPSATMAMAAGDIVKKR
jgi:hypothetical protein